MLNWELAGLTDEEGRLRAALPEQQGIITCPNVTLQGDNIIFAVPDDWTRPISSEEMVDIFGFLSAGWQKRDDTSNLLEEILNLANDPHEVLSFAKKWGPLWMCCDDYHVEECGEHDWFHYWKPENFVVGFDFFSCQWNGTEKIQDYIEFSRRTNAVMNVAAHLQKDELAPSSTWLEFMGFKEDSLEVQRLILASFLSDLITSARLKITPDLTLCFITGFGFRPAAYLQLVQVITGTPGLFVCDGCGKRYIRTGRKPARGRKNFCPVCSKGGRGSKRVWARDH